MGSDIGRKLRQIRQARGKSLAVIAGRAGISAGYLSRLESGERALDRRSLITALAEALEVAPSELTGGPFTAPRSEHDDAALVAVRQALLAVSLNEPFGVVQPVEQLSVRLAAVLKAQNDADTAVVGAALPSLIQDLHATLNARQREHEVLRLLTLAHMQGTQAWLAAIGAPIDLGWQAATLARQAAERLGDPTALAIGAYGTALSLLSAGSFDLAARTLVNVELVPVTAEDAQLAGSLALASSLIAAARKDNSERTAALEYAADLAERTGETNMLGFGFGPSNVAVWRLQGALEAGDYADAAAIGGTVNPAALTVRAREAVYWREYGRSLAHLPKRREDAVHMLRKAESISPDHVHRHPFTRATLAELLSRAKRDAVGRELRGLAYRAGLHV